MNPSADPRDPLPGTVVNGKFRVLSVLAHGGMGKIYRAEQVPLGRPVALKVLRTKYADELDDDPHFHRRFFLEASILSKLQHANIVTLYDYGRIEGIATEQYFMAMEFLRGETLSQRLRDVGALAPESTLKLVRQMAKGLREAHKLGIVHRDLKPSNIMLVPEEDGAEVVKILDFGIGKLIAADSEDLTAEGSFVGSPRYMAPEQIHEGKVDARSDIYSLGVMMYECFTGRIPFDGETNIAIMMAHCNQPVPPMRARSPSVAVPEILESFVRLCLEKNPTHRPQTMEEFVRGLRACEVELFGHGSGVVSAPAIGALAPASGSGPTKRSGDLERAPVSPEAPTLSGVVPAVPSPASSQPRGSQPVDIAPTGTHRSLTRSWNPPAPTAKTPARDRAAFLAVAVGLLLLGVSAIALGLFLLSRHHTPDAPRTSASSPTSSRSVFTLIVESTPAGAEVADVSDGGEAVLGTTPLHMPIERASVKRAPRRLVLRLAGYAPYTLLQPDSEGDVHVLAELAAMPARISDADADATASTAARSASPLTPAPKSKPASTSATARPVNPDLDIKLKR